MSELWLIRNKHTGLFLFDYDHDSSTGEYMTMWVTKEASPIVWGCKSTPTLWCTFDGLLDNSEVVPYDETN